MSKRKCEWQDTDYVLSYFGKRIGDARRRYLSYVSAGIDEGRRPELVGGGLIRSVGGWLEAKKQRLKGKDRVRGDERILGDSDFVLEILTEADEKLDRYYELKSLGYDLKRAEQKVCEIYDIEPEDIYLKSREKIRVEARSLFCYWAVRELGYGLSELGRRLSISQPGVGHAVSRAERIANDNKYQPVDRATYLFMNVAIGPGWSIKNAREKIVGWAEQAKSEGKEVKSGMGDGL